MSADKYGFTLGGLSDEKDLTLFCDTEEDLEDWRAAIEEGIHIAVKYVRCDYTAPRC